MSVIKRENIEIGLIQYQDVFYTMPDPVFVSKFEKEVDKIRKEIVNWSESLRKFIETQNRQVKELFDNEYPVDIETVYVPLNIIEEKPKEVKLVDETTYSEIALMRKISKKEISLINFKRELQKYNLYSVQGDLDTDMDNFTQSNESVQPELKVKYSPNPQIWLILSNPGSGKSYLRHITALRFGKKELTQFAYCLSIPCRNPDWHQMEQENAENKSMTILLLTGCVCLCPLDRAGHPT